MRGVVGLSLGRKFRGISVHIVLETHLNPVVHLRL